MYGEYVIVMSIRDCVNQVIQRGFNYNDLSIGRVVNDFTNTRIFNNNKFNFFLFLIIFLAKR